MSTEIFELAYDSILEADSDKATEALDKAKAAGVPLIDVLNEGFSKGIDEVGERFSSGEVFMPELILAAKVMAEASTVVTDDIKANGGEVKSKGKMIMATVAGDVHDIGKGICCTMLRASGIDVVDLGRDVSVDDIIEQAVANNVDAIGTSTLLTMCMKEQKDLEDKLKEKGLRDKFKTFVGGAPVTKNWAKKIGADYYCNDASDLAKTAAEVLEK